MYSKVSTKSQCFLRFCCCCFLYLAVQRQQLKTPIVYFPDDTGLIKLITDDDTPTNGNRYSQLCGLVCRGLPPVSRGKDEANTF